MTREWLWSSWPEVGLVVLSSVLVVVATIAVIRVVGLRSLSKMTSTDFAVTVAIGSIVGGVASTSNSLLDGALAIAALLGFQSVIGWFRVSRSPGALVDNEPVLLMLDGSFRPDAMSANRVTEHDVIAKLREANVRDLDQVLAVVLETTGDVTVIHGDGPLDERLLDGVRRPTTG